eukprot:5123209-Alexandrium_andersonii.AAC.1
MPRPPPDRNTPAALPQLAEERAAKQHSWGFSQWGGAVAPPRRGSAGNCSKTARNCWNLLEALELL